MDGFRYRLDPLLERRKAAKQEAEADLAARQKELRETQRYAEELAGKERDARERKDTARRTLLEGGRNGRTLAHRKDHLRFLEQVVVEARNETFVQRQEVERCVERLVDAQRILAERSREVEVLEKHRERSEQRWEKEVERKEALEQDEIGSSQFVARRRRS
jgi:flagellar export protein FliJ